MKKAGHHILLALCVLLLLQGRLQAQIRSRVIATFENATFPEFVREVEQQTGLKIYYDPAATDSITVTIAARDMLPDSLLRSVLRSTTLRVATTRSGQVFITEHYPVHTELPAGFFDRSVVPADTGRQVPPFFARGAGSDQERGDDLENKLLVVGEEERGNGKTSAIVAGHVRDRETGEAIAGASVVADESGTAVLTDAFGYYSITLARGRHSLGISSAGMKKTRRQIMLRSDGKLDVDMSIFIPSLKNVIVTAEKSSNTRSLQMGLERLGIRSIRQVPVVLGEADLLRVMLTLPGVSSVGEASTGFNVRGGSADQNLILFNDATVYNPSHLFGFFSSFNPDIVRNVELYKSAIPEKYGGRLSSVLDVSSRDGNSKKFSGKGGIGALTGKLLLEGPLSKDKTTFILGGRTTYSNWILRTLPNDAYNRSRASFFDGNLHLAHTANARNSFFLTGYISGDRFRLNNDTLYRYSNRNVNLKWRHHFNSALHGVFTGGLDQYQYAVSATARKADAFRLDFSIQQLYLKADFSLDAGTKHSVDFGLNTIRYGLQPGTFSPVGSQSLIVPDKVRPEQALESAVYVGDQFTISPDFSIHAGVRFSVYNYLGAQQEFRYVTGQPRAEYTISDTVFYGKGKPILSYSGPEYRITLRYSLSDNSSLKAGFHTLRQYIHLLSTAAAISPTDVWKLSNRYIRPQNGFQVSAGYYLNLADNTIETSLEFYYRQMEHIPDFKSGATIIMNKHVETELINTRGRAYGAELLIRKAEGRFNGWLSYTWSRSRLQQDDPLAGETINEGAYYPANFDKPHTVNLVSNYRFSHRYSISFSATYNTGRPVTLPVAVFNLGGAQRVLYSDRNAYRIPDYFRADLSVQIESGARLKKLTHSSWAFGVYNVTARQNAFSVYFVQENGTIRGYKLSVFGTAIPYITWQFTF